MLRRRRYRRLHAQFEKRKSVTKVRRAKASYERIFHLAHTAIRW